MRIEISANVTLYRVVDIDDNEPSPDFWQREGNRLMKEAIDDYDYSIDYIDHYQAGNHGKD